MAMFYFQILSKSNNVQLVCFFNCSFCIIHTRKAELRRAVEERRKRRHHEGDGEESYDGDREKRRRTSSSNSQKSDKLDNHSSGTVYICCY